MVDANQETDVPIKFVTYADAFLFFQLLYPLNNVCFSFSLPSAVQLLGHNEELDLGRELNKLYRLVIEGQEGLMSLKGQLEGRC